MPAATLGLLDERRRAFIVMRGEVEHLLGIADLLRRISKLFVEFDRWRSKILRLNR